MIDHIINQLPPRHKEVFITTLQKDLARRVSRKKPRKAPVYTVPKLLPNQPKLTTILEVLELGETKGSVYVAGWDRVIPAAYLCSMSLFLVNRLVHGCGVYKYIKLVDRPKEFKPLT